MKKLKDIIQEQTYLGKIVGVIDEKTDRVNWTLYAKGGIELKLWGPRLEEVDFVPSQIIENFHREYYKQTGI